MCPSVMNEAVTCSLKMTYFSKKWRETFFNFIFILLMLIHHSASVQIIGGYSSISRHAKQANISIPIHRKIKNNLSEAKQPNITINLENSELSKLNQSNFTLGINFQTQVDNSSSQVLNDTTLHDSAEITLERELFTTTDHNASNNYESVQVSTEKSETLIEDEKELVTLELDTYVTTEMSEFNTETNLSHLIEGKIDTTTIIPFDEISTESGIFDENFNYTSQLTPQEVAGTLDEFKNLTDFSINEDLQNKSISQNNKRKIKCSEIPRDGTKIECDSNDNMIPSPLIDQKETSQINIKTLRSQLEKQTATNTNGTTKNQLEIVIVPNNTSKSSKNVEYEDYDQYDYFDSNDSESYDFGLGSNTFTFDDNNNGSDYEYDYDYSDYEGDIAGLDITAILKDIDLSQIDFNELDLSTLDLTGVDLSGIDFSKLPSNINLENFDISKLPKNIDFDTLNFTTLPDNISVSGLSLSDFNSTDFDSVDLDKLLPNKTIHLTGSEHAVRNSVIENFDHERANHNPTFGMAKENLKYSKKSILPNEKVPIREIHSTQPNKNALQVKNDLRTKAEFTVIQKSPLSQRNTETNSYVYKQVKVTPSVVFPGQITGHAQDYEAPLTISPYYQFYQPQYYPSHPAANTYSNPFRQMSLSYPDPNYVSVVLQGVPLFNAGDYQIKNNGVESYPERKTGVQQLEDKKFFEVENSNKNNENKFRSVVGYVEDIKNNQNITDLQSVKTVETIEVKPNMSKKTIDQREAVEMTTDNTVVETVETTSRGMEHIVVTEGTVGNQSSTDNTVVESIGTTSRVMEHVVVTEDSVGNQSSMDVLKVMKELDSERQALLRSPEWVTEEEADEKLVSELGIGRLTTMAKSVSFSGSGNMDFLICTMCKTGVLTGKKLMNNLHKSDREIKSLIIYICVEFDLFPRDVCRGMINSMGSEVLEVIRHARRGPARFCASLLPARCQAPPLPPWPAPSLPPAPAPAPAPAPVSGDLQILHITDLHLDLEYSEGAVADCDELLCCRQSSAAANVSAVAALSASVINDADDPDVDVNRPLTGGPRFPRRAGRWGSLGRCDLPRGAVRALLQQGASLRPDLVYISGDLAPHDVWRQTRAGVLAAAAAVASEVEEAFPATPVVWAVGNIDVTPANSFPTPGASKKGHSPVWAYEALARQWGRWLPSEARRSMRRGGHYSVAPLKGLRVISLNTNYCNSMNWWLLLAHRDPIGQLAWLTSQLSAASANGERVHIVTHFPPGSSACEANWSKRFAAIVTRYADVITGVFAGHQHMDQWQIIHDPATTTTPATTSTAVTAATPTANATTATAIGRPVAVTYIAPSATTFRRHSPSFRVYSVDGSSPNATWGVADHTTFTANVTEANAGAPFSFLPRYSAREAFGLTDLSPQSWVDLVYRMARDRETFDQHLRYKHNYWAAPTEVTACDARCRQKSLCFLLTGDSSNPAPCQRLRESLSAP